MSSSPEDARYAGSSGKHTDDSPREGADADLASPGSSPHRTPRQDVEATVMRICAEVLEADRVERTDSFFELGGTSLQAIRICSRVGREFRVDVEPDALFEYDVVADFAEQVAQVLTGGGSCVDAQ